MPVPERERLIGEAAAKGIRLIPFSFPDIPVGTPIWSRSVFGIGAIGALIASSLDRDGDYRLALMWKGEPQGGFSTYARDVEDGAIVVNVSRDELRSACGQDPPSAEVATPRSLLKQFDGGVIVDGRAVLRLASMKIIVSCGDAGREATLVVPIGMVTIVAASSVASSTPVARLSN